MPWRVCSVVCNMVLFKYFATKYEKLTAQKLLENGTLIGRSFSFSSYLSGTSPDASAVKAETSGVTVEIVTGKKGTMKGKIKLKIKIFLLKEPSVFSFVYIVCQFPYLDIQFRVTWWLEPKHRARGGNKSPVYHRETDTCIIHSNLN